ncbi:MULTISPECIES: fimbria/pilus chaperone family protein [Pseudomonas]|uniref:Fimbrial chaperone protein n=1 Tax=Pseudomonas frederiksbergensis TaxID=104087 RepID=A0A2S8HTE4_9PSED|nr:MULTISPECIES: fimbria/pilus chaperone family protein [Pseudomonas]PQP05826.1 fimbrial chaperone protein [Pseudomonas frederiksbergensis]WLG51880.1 fimbria/pilus chaperone family protein [Pseudomonas sp. FP1742]
MTMFSVFVRPLIHAGAGVLTLLMTVHVQADGMVPNTSVVIVNEADGEASVSVTNTDSALALMHVTLENIAEDPESLVFVTPPLARVEASKTQLVRFILQSEKPLLTQRLKRVIFEGIPQGKPTAEAGQARVGVTVRQNLPVILHPKGLAPNRTPWTDLKWSLSEGRLTVRNDTPYVVRLGQEVQLLPSAGSAMLPKTYVLPGEHISVVVPAGAATHVRFQPATLYGFAVPLYDAPIRS